MFVYTHIILKNTNNITERKLLKLIAITYASSRHRTETPTQRSGNPGLISHNSQHTKAGNS